MSSQDPTEIELTLDNPWRPVDWRWQRALKLHQEEFTRNRRFDDQFIVGAVKFLEASESAEDSPNQALILALRQPALHWAIELSKNPDNAWRAEVEARVLSGESGKEICKRMGMREDVLRTYESLFYDVRDRLNQPAYVMHVAIGQALHRGLRETDWPLLWKFYGYTYGPRMLDAVIGQAIAPGRPRTADDVKFCFQDDGMASVLRKQALAARTVPINSFTQLDVLSVYAKFVEIERVTGESRSVSDNTLLANVQKMMGMLPLAVGDAPIKSGMDSSILDQYDSTGTELPTRLLMSAAAGVRTAEFDELDNLSYPEPVNHARTEPTV